MLYNTQFLLELARRRVLQRCALSKKRDVTLDVVVGCNHSFFVNSDQFNQLNCIKSAFHFSVFFAEGARRGPFCEGQAAERECSTDLVGHQSIAEPFHTQFVLVVVRSRPARSGPVVFGPAPGEVLTW